MPNVPFYGAGAIGVNKDLPTEEMDPREWSDVRGVRFQDNKAIRAFGDSDVFGAPLGTPYWIMPVQAGAIAVWVYADLTKLYATDGAAHADVSRTVGGAYTMDDKNLWHGGTLSQIPIITNGTDKPQMWINPSLATDFADLTNWPAADRCELIKPFKQFMVSMVVQRGGVSYKHLVKWSHPAVPGAVPSSWDETDPTKLAGEVEILDELPGGIRDGLGLRNTFVIYKDNSTWAMQFVGGNSVFNFYPIFLQSGILSRHCVSTLNNGAMHFVATGDDFIIHDGQNASPVFTKRMKTWILNTIPATLADYCFTVVKNSKNEVWFCFPESGGKYPTLAAVYNWQDKTTSIRALPAQTSFADIGPIAASSDPWDADAGTWDSDTTTWDLSLFSPHFFQIVSSNPIAVKLTQLDDGINYASGYLERTGLALIGQDRVSGELKADNEMMKIVHRLWPKATGAAFNITLGGQEFINAPIVWGAPQLFTPGVQKYLDFIPVNARFIAVRFDWQGNGVSEIAGYNMPMELLGQQ